MGVNDEYSRDAYLGDHYVYDSDGESEEFDSQLDPEDWQSVYSEDLLDAWLIIYDELIRTYLTHTVTYPQFVDFVMRPSQWRATVNPSPIHRLLWSSLSNIETIWARVQPEEFYGWANHHLMDLF